MSFQTEKNAQILFNTRQSNARHHFKQNKICKLCAILVKTKITSMQSQILKTRALFIN